MRKIAFTKMEGCGNDYVYLDGFSEDLRLAEGIFFADSAVDAGWSNAWLYSLAYNGSTIGAETVLCVLVSLLPPVKKVLGLMKSE